MKLGALLLPGSLLVCSAAIASVPPADALARIRTSRLEPSRTVALRDVVIDLGEATLRVSKGVLVPSSPVSELPAEMVFVGEATFELAPVDDRVERRQLEMFTGSPSLSEPVGAVVLVLPATRWRASS